MRLEIVIKINAITTLVPVGKFIIFPLFLPTLQFAV